MFIRGIIVILGIWSQVVISPPLNKDTIVEDSIPRQKKVFKSASDLKIPNRFPGTEVFSDLQNIQNGYQTPPAIEGNNNSLTSRCAPGAPVWLLILLGVILLLLVVDATLTFFVCKKWRRTFSQAALTSSF